MSGAVPTLTLLHGAEMPRIGLGTWPMDDREAERAVAEALGMGTAWLTRPTRTATRPGWAAGSARPACRARRSS